jgi:GPH family glycoside/pentoside/hexuronide:cation symporter
MKKISHIKKEKRDGRKKIPKLESRSAGLASALTGFLLSAGGYINGAEVQPASCISMLNFMYLVLPLILGVISMILLALLKVEKANADWDASHGKVRG